MLVSNRFNSSKVRGGILLGNSGSIFSRRSIGFGLPPVRVSVNHRLGIVVKPMTGLAVGTDILGLLAQISATQRCAPGILEGMQADRTQRDEGYGIQIARVATAHS